MTNELYSASDTIKEIKFDIVVSDKGIREIFINKKQNADVFTNATKISLADSRVKDVFKQLVEYLNRGRKDFNLSLEIVGTDFQRKVWNELTKI
jgi:O6-methylguanine-DNA--protein-cysteine methyltransferase